MSLKRNERYPGRFSNPTTAQPQGAFKNRTAPNAQDGSYLEQDWANDWSGFFGRLLTVAGITPNGNVDTALSSQYYDALTAIVLPRANIATEAQMKEGTSLSLVPSVKAVMSLFPNRNFSIPGYIRIPDVPGGLVIQWGKYIPSAGSQNVNLLVSYPTAQVAVMACLNGKSDVYGFVTAEITNTSQVLLTTRSQSGNLITGSQIHVISIGY